MARNLVSSIDKTRAEIRRGIIEAARETAETFVDDEGRTWTILRIPPERVSYEDTERSTFMRLRQEVEVPIPSYDPFSFA